MHVGDSTDSQHEGDGAGAGAHFGELVAGGLEPEIANWLAHFLPRKARRDVWPIVRPFVISSMLILRPTGISTAGNYVWSLMGIAIWGLGQGLPLDPEVLLTPDNVELYCSTAVPAKSRPSVRSTLRRIGPRLTRRAPWPPRAEPLRARIVAPPYTAMELAGLRLDASRQSTPERRRASEAILTLGAGVGLDGRWSMDVRGSDISRQGAVVLVEVGSPTARVVPVLAAFENDLLKLADLAGEDYLVGGKARSKNKASRALNRFESGPGDPN